MRVLILGASGMLGCAVLRKFDEHPSFEAWGLVRDAAFLPYFSLNQQCRIVAGVDVLDDLALRLVLDDVDPDVVINCVGIIKQRDQAKDPLLVLPINSLLPHRLAGLCEVRNIRLVHISTDCVFSGSKGAYQEADFSDATDLYGKSKYLGELHDWPSAVTLRTSIVGHELKSRRALLEWFLAQQGMVHGFTRSFFSGVTATELACVIRDFVLPDPTIHGLYHVSSDRISKFDFLKLVTKIYRKNIDLVPIGEPVIDRSLDSSRFRLASGYRPPSWRKMLSEMRDSEKSSNHDVEE